MDQPFSPFPERTGLLAPVEKVHAEAAVRTLLRFLGDDPERSGLRDTPERVVRAYAELFAGYAQNPHEILRKNFQEENFSRDEMIVVSDIPFVSTCEHHLERIIGTASFGYIPKQHVVGLSKIARLVDVFARRLQVQERMTIEIADTFQEVVQPIGCGLVVRAEHQCMSCRGVQKAGVSTITSRMTGVFKSQAATRDEFLRLIETGRR